MKLKIAHDFSIPIEAVTQTFGILAIRGVGKTYTASVLAEEMLGAGLPIIVLDPTGAWWGLRASADGKGPGYPIVVMGGDHGDVPLEPTAGEVLADFAVEERQSMVLDLSHFRKSERARFVTDFCERLYLKNREALHLFLDEADAFAPQRPMHGEERMLGALEDIVRRGRIRGLGVTLITQRAAVINKDVLSQVEVLIALRTIGSHDRQALDAWIEAHGTERQREAMMSSLASLPKGEAWFWSPGWLDEFRLIKIRKRITFNSSATPKVGEKLIEPRKLAEVDLAALSKRIALTIERVKQDDPKVLRQKIAELQKQLSKDTPVVPPKIERVEVPVLRDSQIHKLEKISATLHNAGTLSLDTARAITAMISKASQMMKPVAPVLKAPYLPPKRIVDPRVGQENNGVLSKAERAMLTVLAQFPNGRTKSQVGILSGYSPNSGTFSTYLGGLRSKGYVEGHMMDLLITEAGKAALGSFEPLPTGGALQQFWMNKLRKGEAAILETLLRAYPNTLTKELTGQGAGYSHTSGTFSTYLGKLRTLELVTGRGDMLRASEELFG